MDSGSSIANIFDTPNPGQEETAAEYHVQRQSDANVERAIKSRIREIHDYPRPGVVFRDISPLLEDGEVFPMAVRELAGRISHMQFDRIVGIEARGFVIGSALAFHTGKGFIMARKKGKLPFKTVSIGYELEYGPEAMEMHVDSIAGGTRVLIVDDLLATGGTAKAAADLVGELGGTVAGFAFMIELRELGGRGSLEGYDVECLIEY